VIQDIGASIVTKTFSNGKAVLSQLKACNDHELPDLLILDYSMPELTGYQVLKEIYNQPRYGGISKFVFSTSCTTRFMEECLSVGAKAYFVKPASMEELRTIAQKMLFFQ
jgi:CheY-like chemotaxis protein